MKVRQGKLTSLPLFVTLGLFGSIVLSDPGLAQPLAAELDKWLGCVHSSSQVDRHELYWNQVTPENAGKWGSVESARDEMNWVNLDAAQEHAKAHQMRFRFHVLVWGSQQPAWISGLPQDEQLAEIEEWFQAVAERYPDIDYLEVVNEPLHQPPSYAEALGGDGDTGWDWIITAFEMARDVFPDGTKLIINDYGMLNDLSSAARYREIIELLQERGLIDGIGVQGHAFNTRRGSFNGKRVLDLLGDTGLPIQVTEMDVDGNPNSDPNLDEDQSDQNQLEDMQRIFPVLWEHPSVEGITFWGWRFGLWRQSQEAYLTDRRGADRPALEWLRTYLEQYRSILLSSEGEGEVPTAQVLLGNYPNPFNGVTQIRYRVSEPGFVTLKVYDLLGREVATLVDHASPAGEFSVGLDAGGLESGGYLYRLETANSTATGRALVIN